MKIEQSIETVVILMANARLEGNLHMPAGGRLTDYLALAERKFIPLTEVKIFSHPGETVLYSVPFANVNKDSILLLFPKT
ncbi:MAG: hypothetical protein NC924_08165 [Candidatus Omnitrophica bacterium]|nr:hypothetical protein [Candidatus Omnitrophota bacterium]